MHTIPHLFARPVITLDVIILLAACVLHAMICILVGMAWCQVPASLWACAVFYGLITCTLLVPIMHCDNLLSWIACNITPMPSSYTAPLQATLILYVVFTMTLLVILLFCMKHPDVHWNNLTCALLLLLSDLGFTSLPATESGRLVGAVCFVFQSVYCVTTVLLELSVSQLPLTIRCLAAPPWACILLLASSDSSSLFSGYHCPLYRCYTYTPPTPTLVSCPDPPTHSTGCMCVLHHGWCNTSSTAEMGGGVWVQNYPCLHCVAGLAVPTQTGKESCRWNVEY